MTENETRNEVTILRAALEAILGDDLQLPDYYYDMIEAALATPSAAPEQTAKPRHYVNTIAAHNSEMCCRLGITMGHLRDDGSRELECILERLDRAQKQIAQQAAPEQPTSEYSQVAPSISQAVNEQAAFEAWAKREGISFQRTVTDACMDGRFPATYFIPATETAWRAWANKPVLQQAAPEQATPGWKLVPVEPTDEMLRAGDCHMDGISQLGDAWDAMLTAAPSPQQRDESKRETT